MEFDASDVELKAVLRYLKWILDNLEYIQGVEDTEYTIYADELDLIDHDLGFIPEYGLCDNILAGYLEQQDIYDLFKSWGGSSVDLLYPCGDRDDFLHDSVNLYLNPKRISLINHIIEKITEELENRNG